MSSNCVRLVLPAGLAILLGGMIVSAQDSREAEPAGQGDVYVFNAVEARAVVHDGELLCRIDPAGGSTTTKAK